MITSMIMIHNNDNVDDDIDANYDIDGWQLIRWERKAE